MYIEDEALNHPKPRTTEHCFPKHPLNENHGISETPLGNTSGGFGMQCISNPPLIFASGGKNHTCVFNHRLYLQAVVLKSRVIYFTQKF